MRVHQDGMFLPADAQAGDEVWLDSVGAGTQTLYRIVSIDVEDGKMRLERVEPIQFRRRP